MYHMYIFIYMLIYSINQLFLTFSPVFLNKVKENMSIVHYTK